MPDVISGLPGWAYTMAANRAQDEMRDSLESRDEKAIQTAIQRAISEGTLPVVEANDYMLLIVGATKLATKTGSRSGPIWVQARATDAVWAERVELKLKEAATAGLIEYRQAYEAETKRSVHLIKPTPKAIQMLPEWTGTARK